MTDSMAAARPWPLSGAEWLFIPSRNATTDVLNWTWRARTSSGVLWQNDLEFETLGLCRSDAVKHGYEPVAARPPPHTR